MAETEEMLDDTYLDENSIIVAPPEDQISQFLAFVGAPSNPITQDTFDNGVDQFVAEFSHLKQSPTSNIHPTCLNRSPDLHSLLKQRITVDSRYLEFQGTL